MSEEEKQIKNILNDAWSNSNKEFRKQAVDTAASYGKVSINHLLSFSESINDREIKDYINKKIQEIKSKSF